MLTVLMIIFGVGAVLSLRSAKQGAEWGTPAAVVCAILTVGLAIGQAVGSGAGKGAAMKAAQRYQSVLAECVGSQFAERYAGKRVVVLVSPRMEDIEFVGGMELALETRLVELLSATAAWVETVPLPLPPEYEAEMQRLKEQGDEYAESEMGMYLMEASMSMDPTSFNSFLASLKDRADVVVSAITFGMELSASDLPKAGSVPDLAMLNALVMDAEEALKNTALDALVEYRIDATWDPKEKLPSDDWEVFNKRYRLITRDEPTGVTKS